MKIGTSRRISVMSAFAAGLSLTALSVTAQAPEGYYNSLDGKSGDALWKAVKEIGFKGHKRISYGDNTWTAFRQTDTRTVNGTECWWDMYSSNNVPISSGHPDMNIEHSVANSWWDGTKNDAYCDIVHLNPSDKDANNRKSNFPLGIVATKTFDNGVTIVGKPASGYGGGSSNVYEPCDEYKGDFARVFMYMFVIYDDMAWGTRFTWMYDTSSELMFKPWAYNMLLEWSAADPVSQKEIYRNNGIAKTQGNRNPFIDLPDLADYIWGAKRGQKYSLDGNHDPIVPDPDDPDDPKPDVPEPDEPVAPEGSWLLVDSQDELRDGSRYVIVASSDEHVTLSTKLNTGSNSNFSPGSSVSVTDRIIKTVPEDAAVITLEGSGSNFSLLMSDISGNRKGYISSTSSKKMTLSETKGAAGTVATLTVAGGETAVDFGSAGYFYYNQASPRFTTYTSSQTPLQFYRYIPSESSEVRDAEIFDDSILVEVWGNNILAPEGARIFDLNGREVGGENLSKGIYIVTKPSFEKAVKVIIR